jgi:PKD repeat protein
MYHSIKYACLIVSILLAAFIKATPIDSTTAKIAAANFYALRYSIKNPNLSLVYTEMSPEGEPAYYIYNVYPDSGRGFVIISADDAAHPIIGYSSEGYYSLAHLSTNFTYWMKRYKTQVADIRQRHVKPTADIADEWNAYKNNMPLKRAVKSSNSVTPLVSTMWAQAPYFNAECPGNCVAGCVATAMGQIMKYWAYPPHGVGTSSYTDAPFGALSAIYDTTHYYWSEMPANIVRKNPQVATLMYDCGISVNMSYVDSSSSSYMIVSDNPPSGISAQSAFMKYFGYNSSTIQGLYMSNYSGSEWISLLENELNNKRPFQYAGSGNQGGHSWVCDGYESNNYFHMNWGWAGYEDGYFNLSSLNPDNIPLSDGEEALIGIQPAPAVADFNGYPLIVWAGDTVHFIDNSFGTSAITAWQWSFEGAINPGSTIPNPMAIYTTPGSYFVSETVTSGQGNGTSTKLDYVLVLPNNTVNVYPTLSDGKFTAQLHDASLADNNIRFSLYNELGQKVYTTTLVQYRTSITVNVPHGIYIFRAFDASGKPISTGKMMIK